jgi:DNA-binding NarL/FixJ family response regulator
MKGARRTVAQAELIPESSLVLCNNVTIAHALIRGLELQGAHAMELPGEPNAFLHRECSGRPPALAFIIESNAAVIAAAIQALRRRWEAIKVVVVGVPKHEDATLDAFAAGAHGIVLNGESLDRVVLAAHHVLANRFHFPPQMVAPLIDRLVRLRSAGQAGDGKPPVVRLSPRESQILSCFRRGLVDKEIAVEFGIEVQTVKNENTRLFQKLGVHNRYDASRVATGNLTEKQPGGA